MINQTSNYIPFVFSLPIVQFLCNFRIIVVNINLGLSVLHHAFIDFGDIDEKVAGDYIKGFRDEKHIGKRTHNSILMNSFLMNKSS